MAETWTCEKPGEAVGKGAAWVTVETLGLRGSWREIEAWHCVARSVSQKRLLMQVQFVETRAHCRQQSYGKIAKDSGRYGMELAWSWPGPMRQALWANDGRAWRGRAAQAFWSPEHYEWIPGARHWAAGFNLHCWRLVFIWFVCNHALVIPSWSKKYVTQFGVYRNTWETLDFKEILERLNF